VPEDWKGRSAQPGTSFRIGHLMSKVEPVYPQDALRQQMAGRVKLHVIIGRDGAVESAKVLEGAGLLNEAALRAVQQWRYEATLLGGEAIEIEQDITVAFRISSPASR
jgi:protein TonB